MLYILLADGVVLFHLAFILFAPFGGLLLLRWSKLAWLHVPAVLWAIIIQIFGLNCPLTGLENLLREAGGEAGYQGGFIQHYLLPLIYHEALTRPVQVWIGVGVLVLNAALYGWLVHRIWRRRQGTPQD